MGASFKEIEDICYTMWGAAQQGVLRKLTTVCVLGPPGIGKSAMAHAVFKRIEAWDASVRLPEDTRPQPVFRFVDLSSAAVEDIGGLPHLVTSGDTWMSGKKITNYAPQEWFVPFCHPEASGVLVLDDLPAAASNVQTACRQLVLDRAINGLKIGKDVLLVVTGNRRSDQSNASRLPAHFLNSVQLLPLEPDLDEWTKWYVRQGLVDYSVVGFLKYRPEFFSQLPEKASPNGAFATPRSWFRLGEMLGSVERLSSNTRTVSLLASGTVGDGVALEFTAFKQLQSKFAEPSVVLDDPKRHIPNPAIFKDQPSELIALLTALVELTAKKIDRFMELEKQGQPVVRKEVVTCLFKFLYALAHITQDRKEFLGFAVTLLLVDFRTRFILAHYTDKMITQNPEIKSILSSLSAALASVG